MHDSNSKPSLLIVFLIQVGTIGAVISASGALVQVLLGSGAGAIGGAVGLALASVVLIRRTPLQFHPLVWFGIVGGGIGLYLLFQSVLAQLQGVVLPAYLPSAWIAGTSHAGIGLLVGAGVPLLLSALVSTGYQLLE